MLTTNPNVGPALPIPLNPQIIEPAPAPAARPWYAKWLERKFLFSIGVSAMGLFAFFSGAAPLSFELVGWIVAPLVLWLGIETKLDLSRITIPDVPGKADDVARILLKVLQVAQSAEQPAPATPAPPSAGPVQTSAPKTDGGFASPGVAIVLALLVGVVALWALPAAAADFPVNRTYPYAVTTAGTFGRVSVTNAAGGTTVLAASSTRRSFSIQNTGAVVLYCARGTTVSAANYAVVLEPNVAGAADRGGQAWTVDGWGGAVQCLAAGAGGLVGVDSF